MSKQDGRKLNHQALETLRLLAVRRVVEGGEKPGEVMRSPGLCRTSIYPWLRKHKKNGGEALRMRKASGPKPKLNEKQRQQVSRWIIGKDPRQHGFDFGLWTRQIVAQLVEEKFGIGMKLTAVGRLLARMGITPQKPLRRAYERDPAAVEQWVQQDYPRLRRRARKHGATIFFLDEAGFSSEPNLGRTHGRKGETPVVQTTGQRQKVSAISASECQGWVLESGLYWDAQRRAVCGVPQSFPSRWTRESFSGARWPPESSGQSGGGVRGRVSRRFGVALPAALRAGSES